MSEVADRLLSPVAVIAPDSTLLYVNAAAARAVGHEPGWLLGTRMLDLIHPEDRRRVSRELRQVVRGRPSAGVTTYRIRADAAREWRVFESIADNVLDDPRVSGILISSRDVTEQRAHERELYDAAYRDPLTGLPNQARLRVDLVERMNADSGLVVAFVGLERFQLINESLGHSAGDEVLRVVAARLRDALPASAVVGRFGTDMFVLLLDAASGVDVRPLMWGVIERLGAPMYVEGRELRVVASVGVVGRETTATAESLLRDASLALHHAKSVGGGRVEVFEQAMRDASVARLELEADLRSSIANDAFVLALQPIVQLPDLVPVKAEALLRWPRADGQLISPATFIPVAEETGLIVPIGEWTLDRAAQLVRRAPGGRVSINLSPRQLAAPGLPERIGRVLRRHRLEGSVLSFEITETMLIEQFDHTAAVLHAIRELGCRVGLDDFGTGYSSLAYLRRLPIDFLKIDGSLTADIDADCQARAITAAIIAMADALDLDVIAEGVETSSQVEVLHELGCGFAQGYFLGRPRAM